MLELADIFCRYGEKYREKHHQQMLPSHFRAMQDIENCRTDYSPIQHSLWFSN
jgi:hypothetical protein